MPRFKVVAWAPDGKRTSCGTYNTVRDLRAGLRAVADSRYFTWHIEIQQGPWGMPFFGLLRAFADGEYAPKTGPYKRDWYHTKDPTDGSHWRLNAIGGLTISESTFAYGFKPMWIEWFPPVPALVDEPEDE